MGKWPARNRTLLGLAAMCLACTHPAKPPASRANHPLPHADPGQFAVLVAEFEGDEDVNRDGEGDTTTRFRRWIGLHAAKDSTSPPFKPQILTLRQGVDTNAPSTTIERRYQMHEAARGLLEKTGAQVILWGVIREVPSGDRMVVLRLTGSRERPIGNAFPLEQEITISMDKAAEVMPILQMILAAEAAGYEDMQNGAFRDELPQRIEQVERFVGNGLVEVEPLLAMALHVQAARTGELALFDKALAMLSEAEKRHPRKDEPGVWARMQAMRASVLSEEDALRTNETMLLEAIAVYVRVAEELTLARGPLDFGLVHNQLGLLYRRLSLVRGSKAPLCFAVNEFEKAAQVTYDGDVPSYMDISLRGVQRGLSELSQGVPSGQKPLCDPPISDTLWRTFLAGERL